MWMYMSKHPLLVRQPSHCLKYGVVGTIVTLKVKRLVPKVNLIN